MAKLLACDEDVTLVRHVKTPTADLYTCEVIRGVSWFEKSGAALDASNGEKPSTQTIVRIPKNVCPAQLPASGDYIVRGALSAASITRAALDAMDAFRVATVGDNRRVFLHHVVVKSA